MTAAESDETGVLLDGRYRLGDCIGEGGMARVYRAEDVILGRTVAIKLIRPGVDGASSERARSEVTALASLNHPSLVTLFDARLVPGQPEYLAMEFVDGPTLAARLASNGPLPPEVGKLLAADLAEALYVVHAAGIVHRDIKPSNVLLSPPQLPGAPPRAKLADFGIAYLLDTARVTSPGMVIGTIAYIAPEQITGSEPGPASDIYSLGLVILEALTGERAHPSGVGMAGALARLERPPAIPRSLGSGWGELLSRMLHPDPSQRPTAAQVTVAARTLTDAAPEAAAAAPSTAVTVPLTAATLIAPSAGVTAAADAPSVPLAAMRSREPGQDRRRTRALAVVGAGLAAVAVAVAVVIGATAPGGSDDIPEPGLTVPAVPTPSETSPADEDTGNGSVVEDPGMTDEERKKLEEEQRKLEEEQRKQAEEQQKKLEEERKKLEEEQEEGDGEGDG